MGPCDLEFHPVWFCDMPKSFFYTDGHIFMASPFCYKTGFRDICNKFTDISNLFADISK
jgi:hypothetical protein